MSDKKQQSANKNDANLAKNDNSNNNNNNNNNNNSSSSSPQGNQVVNQTENTNVFRQLFATLDAEHKKLQDLEQRRLKLTEEMKTLRETLQQENRKLRSKSEEHQSSSRNVKAGSSAAAKKSNQSEEKKQQQQQQKPKPRQVSALSTQMVSENNDGMALSTLANNMNIQEQLVVETLSNPSEPTRSQTGELVVQLIDPNAAIRQLHSIDSPVIWHTPVTSVDLESYLKMPNMASDGTQQETAKEPPEE